MKIQIFKNILILSKIYLIILFFHADEKFERKCSLEGGAPNYRKFANLVYPARIINRRLQIPFRREVIICFVLALLNVGKIFM